MQVKSLVYRLRSSTLIRSFGVQNGVPADPSCAARSLSHSPPCVCNIRSAWASLPLHLHNIYNIYIYIISNIQYIYNIIYIV